MTTLSAFTVTRGFDDRQSERPAHWQDDAACTQIGLVPFFPEKGEPSGPALRICAGCPVKAQCLDTALNDPEIVGIWGGTTTKERQRMRLDRGARAGRRWKP